MSNSFDKIKAATEYLKIVGMSKYIAGFLAVVFATLYLNQLDENAKLRKIVSESNVRQAIFLDSMLVVLDSITTVGLDKRNILITDKNSRARKIDSLLNAYKQVNNDTISIDSAISLIRNL